MTDAHCSTGRPRERLLRIAFVGCGNIAKYHARAALATQRVAITALIDPDPAARAAVAALVPAAGPDTIPEFASLAEAVASDPERTLFEAVDIMVPSFLVDGVDLHEAPYLNPPVASDGLYINAPTC